MIKKTLYSLISFLSYVFDILFRLSLGLLWISSDFEIVHKRHEKWWNVLLCSFVGFMSLSRQTTMSFTRWQDQVWSKNRTAKRGIFSLKRTRKSSDISPDNWCIIFQDPSTVLRKTIIYCLPANVLPMKQKQNV